VRATLGIGLVFGLVAACSVEERPVASTKVVDEIREEVQPDTYSEYMVYARLGPAQVLYSHYRVAGTLSPGGIWTWSWSDPSVADDFRIRRDSLGSLPPPFDEPACMASAQEVRDLLRPLAARRGATHLARLSDLLGTRYILLLEPSWPQSVPPPPP
jgi:hypothetical protein